MVTIRIDFVWEKGFYFEVRVKITLKRSGGVAVQLGHRVNFSIGRHGDPKRLTNLLTHALAAAAVVAAGGDRSAASRRFGIPRRTLVHRLAHIKRSPAYAHLRKVANAKLPKDMKI